MEVIREGPALRKACDEAGRGPIGFVPTMGSLHEGHLSLLRRAREDIGFVVLSIFVNPLQFGSQEDLATYPRDLDRDIESAEKEGCDLVFVPGVEEMYPEGEPQVTVDPGPLGDVLEGASRPGHFRGVCTVVAKLFAMMGPCTAYFGEKDAQQLWLVRRMAADLNMPVDIVSCPTVRETDGLAMSSRNALLSPEERLAATCLFRALSRGAELVSKGERDAHVVKAEMAKLIGAEPPARIDYVAIVEEASFREIDRIREAGSWRITVGAEGSGGEWVSVGPHDETVPLPHARALVAARVGPVRLIDNLALP